MDHNQHAPLSSGYRLLPGVKMKNSHMISMKYLKISTPAFMFFCLVGCSGPEEASVSVDSAKSYGSFEEASKKPDSYISHEEDWTIISRIENGDRVYWFVAPDANKISPAVFKKTVHAAHKNEQETVIISDCKAPKQTCDDLMERFKTLSEKYK